MQGAQAVPQKPGQLQHPSTEHPNARAHRQGGGSRARVLPASSSGASPAAPRATVWAHLFSVQNGSESSLGKLFLSFIPFIFVIALLFSLLHCLLPLLTLNCSWVFQGKLLGSPVQASEDGSRNRKSGQVPFKSPERPGKAQDKP